MSLFWLVSLFLSYFRVRGFEDTSIGQFEWFHLFILFSIIINTLTQKVINIKKIKKGKKQHNVRR